MKIQMNRAVLPLVAMLVGCTSADPDPEDGTGSSGSDPCEDVDCGHGYCRDARCLCDPGWSTDVFGRCSVDSGSGSGGGTASDSCGGIDCGHGYCMNGTCYCDSGWTTDTNGRCSVSSSSGGGSGTGGHPADPCQGVTCYHGHCSNGTCECDAGWTGTSCNQEVLKEYTVTESFEELAFPLVHGDCDMDTDGGDQVPVSTSLTLRRTGSQVQLEIKFSATEDGGDGTMFSGTRTILVHQAENEVVDIVGNTSCSLTAVSNGENHNWTPFPGSCSFASGVQYRIDGSGGDCAIHGVRGSVSFTVKAKP